MKVKVSVDVIDDTGVTQFHALSKSNIENDSTRRRMLYEILVRLKSLRCDILDIIAEEDLDEPQQ